MNIRFIKPSQTFYNQVMSQWFKYLQLVEEQFADQKLSTSTQVLWNAEELQRSFT